MAALALTDRLYSVEVSYGFGGACDGMTVVIDADDADDRYSLGFGFQESGLNSFSVGSGGDVGSLTDQEVLDRIRTIWSYSTGRTRLDDTDTSITISGVMSHFDIDEITERGYFNPLEFQTTHDNYRKVLGAIQTQTQSIEEDDGGVIEVCTRAGKVQEAFRPDGDTYPFRGGRFWRFVQLNDNSFNLVCTFDASREIPYTGAGVNKLPEIQWLMRWLESVRTAGDELDVDTVLNNAYGDATTRYTVTQASGESDFVFRAAVANQNPTVAYNNSTDDYVVSLTFGFTRTVTVDINPNGFRTLLGTADEIDIKTDQLSVAAARGGYDVPLRTNEIQVSANERYRLVNGVMYHEGIDSLGNYFEIPMADGWGFGHDWSDLEDTSVTDQKTLPSDPNIQLIHYSESTDGSLSVPAPKSDEIFNRNYRDRRIHNIGDGDVDIVIPWETGAWFTLRPNEDLILRSFLDKEGGQRISLHEVPVRRLNFATPANANLGQLGDLPYYLIDGTRVYLLPFDWDDSGRAQVDDDVFDFGLPIGTGSDEVDVSNGDDLEDQDEWPEYVFHVKYPGRLSIQAGFTIETQSDASGTLHAWTALRIYQMGMDGTGDPVQIRHHSRPTSITGGDETAEFQSFWSGQVEAGDRFLIGYRTFNHITMSTSDVDITNLYVRAVLEPQVEATA